MAFAALEFAPGRIDHHSWQLLALAAAFCGIAAWSTGGAVLTAFGIAVSLVIGLETMPLIAVLWAGATLAWIFGARGAGRFLAAFSLAFLIIAPLLTLVIAGADRLTIYRIDHAAIR